jgi:hypothetical protein
MRALVLAVLCSAVFAGTLYLGGQSVEAYEGPPASSGVAKATRPNKPAIRFNARDQRAARAALVRRADLGPRWKGGGKLRDRLNVAADAECSNYRPRVWDLVITGAASKVFTHPSGLHISSQSKVLQTPRMVRLDWKRSMEHTNTVSCLRRIIARVYARLGITFVSLNRRPFPRLAPYSTRFRVIAKVRSGRTAPFVVDVVVLGKGRHGLTLTVTAPLRYRATAERVEVRVAKRLLARARS